MSSGLILIILNTIKKINPMNLALLIMFCSTVISYFMFKYTLSSWLSFVLVMVFSSGMMTLFIYVASLTPNEKSNKKPTGAITLLIMLLSLTPYKMSTAANSQSMKNFSNQTLLMIMGVILILTMLAISTQSFNPNQSMSSTF